MSYILIQNKISLKNIYLSLQAVTRTRIVYIFFLFLLIVGRDKIHPRDSDNGGNKVYNVILSCDNIEMQFLDDG